VTGPDDQDAGADRSDAERRRRRAEVFGDVLPESTHDDRDPDGSRGPSGDATDEWLRSNVPPHHG
jgi:hypothetical protein